MKIRPVSEEHIPKVTVLLRNTFFQSTYEEKLFTRLHTKKRVCHEWVCILRGKVAAYILFTNAYNGREVCGLHLAPVAVAPDFQGQGIGSELIRFSLRQDIIRNNRLFVLGNPGFYTRFGFEQCVNPICPFDTANRNFLSLGESLEKKFTIGYEPEFKS